MPWSIPSLEGFALAATIAHDGDGARAAPGIAPTERQQLCALPTSLVAATRGERQERVRRLVAAFVQVRPRAMVARWRA